jgi:hypothetical protein
MSLLSLVWCRREATHLFVRYEERDRNLFLVLSASLCDAVFGAVVLAQSAKQDRERAILPTEVSSEYRTAYFGSPTAFAAAYGRITLVRPSA